MKLPVKHSAVTVGLSLLLLLSFSAQVVAGTLYLHDHEDYWWYVNENPSFSAVVPANAERYTTLNVFGQEVLQMGFKDNSIIFEVGYIEGSSRQSIQDSIVARYKPVVSSVKVASNREITTANDLTAFFYAYEATGAHNRKVMLRSVYFTQGDTIVYLAMFLDSGQYQGDIREYWLRAVNEFEW